MIISFVLITKQFILSRYCKENLYVDKLARAEGVIKALSLFIVSGFLYFHSFFLNLGCLIPFLCRVMMRKSLNLDKTLKDKSKVCHTNTF